MTIKIKSFTMKKIFEVIGLRKIFITMTFIFALIFGTTALAAWNPEYKDDLGNEFCIEKETVTVDKNEGGILEFHANFLRVFSEQGLKKLQENYRANGGEIPDNAAYEMFRVHFKEEGGTKYFSITDSFFIDAESKAIQNFGFTDAPIEWYEVSKNPTADNLFNVAKKYI